MKLKPVAVALIAVTTLAVVSTYVAIAWPHIVEQWYIGRMRSHDPAVVKNALERLGEIGQESAYEAVMGRCLECTPGALIVRTDTNGWEPMSWDRVQPNWRTLRRNAPIMDDEIEATCKIVGRMGPNRKMEFEINEITNESISLRLRMWFAQMVAYTNSDRISGDALAREWKDVKQAKNAVYQKIKNAKPDVMRLYMFGLNSDEVDIRAASCYMLGLLGTREETLPLLKKTLQDSRFEVREIASEAIKLLEATP
jgi:hypothetical protein